MSLKTENQVTMDVWFLLPALLFAFVVASSLLFIWSMWSMYGDATQQPGKDHLKSNQWFLWPVLILQVAGAVMSGTVMMLFKKK